KCVAPQGNRAVYRRWPEVNLHRSQLDTTAPVACSKVLGDKLLDANCDPASIASDVPAAVLPRAWVNPMLFEPPNSLFGILAVLPQLSHQQNNAVSPDLSQTACRRPNQVVNSAHP